MYESYKYPKMYGYTHVKFNDCEIEEYNGIEDISTQGMLDIDIVHEPSGIQVKNMITE